MIILQENIEQLKFKDLVLLECEFCHKPFERQKSVVQRSLRGEYCTSNYCSLKCSSRSRFPANPLSEITCQFCAVLFTAKLLAKGGGLRKFCTSSCSAKSSNIGKQAEKVNCLDSCGLLVSRKNSNLRCQKCYLRNKRETYISRWLEGLETGNVYNDEQLNPYVREYMLQRAGYACIRCSWNKVNPTTGKIPLTINHIDGHSDNTTLGNLEVLCPNCHSLTYNYGALNKGNGRASKRKLKN